MILGDDTERRRRLARLAVQFTRLLKAVSSPNDPRIAAFLLKHPEIETVAQGLIFIRFG